MHGAWSNNRSLLKASYCRLVLRFLIFLRGKLPMKPPMAVRVRPPATSRPSKTERETAAMKTAAPPLFLSPLLQPAFVHHPILAITDNTNESSLIQSSFHGSARARRSNKQAATACVRCTLPPVVITHTSQSR